MHLTISIENVQHVKTGSLTVDLGRNKLTCLIGRNGIGKTTLVKAFRNFRVADTFKKTSIDSIFNDASRIIYRCGEDEYVFTYDANLKSLNCRAAIDSSLRENIEVELPVPYGERFNFFQSISDADLAIRRNVVIENYTRPDELIDFLQGIYNTQKFENLKQIEHKGRSYFCLVLDESRYVREDYLSSGEYFLISLYRKILARRKLIVIDEIDISLDAAAQVHLVGRLREFCSRYEVNVLFTTHSLAMMRTLSAEELLHIEAHDGHLQTQNVSYNYINSLLFGFTGWDKYILTEDEVLESFLYYFIQKYIPSVFYKYKIIYIGGSANTVDLMNRNAQQNFFGAKEDVLTILDGDQRGAPFAQNARDVVLLPWESIEKELFVAYNESGDIPRVPGEENIAGIENPNGKRLYKSLISRRILSQEQIFDYLCQRDPNGAVDFSEKIATFLTSEMR